MTNKGRGWYGDSDGHREAALRSNENWLQTRWRRTKETLGALIPGGD